MLNLFFSYSHADEEFRDQLEKHLSMLKREGLISTWHDRCISPGTDIHVTISQELESADLILLLVSPDFLHSKYCYDIEMQRAMERHREGTARVIPVIVQPCEWRRAPFGALRATPRDGAPIANYSNRNNAYIEVTSDVRSAAQSLLEGRGPNQESIAPTHVRAGTMPARGAFHVPASQNSRLRIKRTFTDRDRDEFLDSAYEIIAAHFEQSLEALSAENSHAEGKFKRIDATHFDASVYIDGSRRAYCRIWRGQPGVFGAGIGYSTSPIRSDNSYNEMLDACDDGYSLMLNATMGIFHGREGEGLLLQSAAEHLWEMFIAHLQ